MFYSPESVILNFSKPGSLYRFQPQIANGKPENPAAAKDTPNVTLIHLEKPEASIKELRKFLAK